VGPECLYDIAVGGRTALGATEVLLAEGIEVDGAVYVVEDLVKNDLTLDRGDAAVALEEAVQLVGQNAALDDELQ
jgi:hypothetical protein